MADIGSTSKTKQSKPQLSPYQEGVKKALGQAGEAHAVEAIQMGVPPQQIEQQAGLIDPQVLQQLTQLSGMEVPAKGDGSLLGDKLGILPALMKTLSGQPSSPFQQKTEPLGLNNAIQLAGFQQGVNKNKMDAEKHPLEMQKLGGEADRASLETEKLTTEIEQMQPEAKISQAKGEAQAKGSFLTANDLFTKFESATQPFVIQRDAYARIKETGANPSPAGDLALLYGYMKLLDPGSTVREGEFATAQNSGSIPQRFGALYNKVVSGKRLTPEQRQDFLARSQRIYSSAESQYSKTRKEYVKLSIANKLDPESIIRDLGIEETASSTPESAPEKTSQIKLPPRSAAPRGAKGWDTEKNAWVY